VGSLKKALLWQIEKGGKQFPPPSDREADVIDLKIVID